MSASDVKIYLDSQNIQYTIIEHPLAYTAQEIAAAAHVPGQQLAKTVMLKIDSEMAMAVLPAPERVNLTQLKEYTRAETVEIADETDFKNMFPDCETGAMPPFGHLYGMQVFAASSLSEEIDIAFCAGTHTELVRISYADFENLVEPVVLDLSWYG